MNRYTCIFLLLFSPIVGSSKSLEPQFVIVDSWFCGFVGTSIRDKSVKAGWKEANKRAANDARIWKGLFVSDTNHSAGRRTLEILSRWTYQWPQTLGGFVTAHGYNTFTRKVLFVDHSNGATAVTMKVSWPGVCLGSYILGRTSLYADPDNKLFQHEYGHYLQSKRMGIAYFIRVGLPAIMSKGDHDKHPVEVDCNHEAFMYWNNYYPEFQNDSLLSDFCGWNFDYNPFPDTIGSKVKSNYALYTYIDYKDSLDRLQVKSLKIKPKFLDYASWVFPPFAAIVGVVNAHRYNKVQLEEEKKITKVP